MAAEAKTVLDSWVRYEGQVKARQQKELADSIIGKIEKELENPKVLDQILKQSVTEVESKCSRYHLTLDQANRHLQESWPRSHRHHHVTVIGDPDIDPTFHMFDNHTRPIFSNRGLYLWQSTN